MKNEKLEAYSKLVVDISLEEQRKDIAEKLGYILGKKLTVEDIALLEEDTFCDEKNNRETRTLEIIKYALDERYCICRDFLKEVENEDNNNNATLH